MNRANIKVAVTMLLIAMISGCFTIYEVDQPAAADAGSDIQMIVTASTNTTDTGTKYGILGLLLPNDWVVNSVTYDGDLGTGTFRSLEDCLADSYPSAVDSCWSDTLELRYPTDDNMHWETWECVEGYMPAIDTNYVDITISATVGSTPGTYNLGYLFSESALEVVGLTPGYEEYGYDHAVSFDNAITVAAVSVADDPKLPVGFSLAQNYPNPFNPETQIEYNLAVTAMVELTIFDISGRVVQTLVNEIQTPDHYNIVFQAENLPSGTYFYRLKAGSRVETRKMVLLQ